MSTQVVTNAQPREGAVRGAGARGGNRGRGGANRGPNRGPRSNVGKTPSKPNVPKAEEEQKTAETSATAKSTPAVEPSESESEAPVCWICAEPVKYYSISECNHRTCHVCALRLRALYKKTDCTFCKDPQPSVIFTVSPDASFADYKPQSIPFKDAKLSIFFETQEMMEETLILLRFNCPDPDCDYIGNGWGDLKLHTRANHGKLMCDLCVRFKKVFAHEHALYPPNVLPVHLPSMNQHNVQKSVNKDQIEGGIHPICKFCRECFFSDDELYSHMREKHEECFICKRNEVRDLYFMNYESLEQHFNKDHYPCRQSQCQTQKFVVFNTTLDLQAHMVEVHGADMSTRDKKDLRRIQADFQFEEVSARPGRNRGNREREREPPPLQHQQSQQHVPPGAAGSSRQTAGGNRRREGFGATLTTGDAPPALSNVQTPVQSRPPSPHRADLDPAVAERHSAFLARLQSLASNPTSAVPAIKASIRGYRASESSARDLVSTIWNVLDRNLEHTASIVNAFVDLLDEEEKKQDLLASWKGFDIEQRRQFPDLVPSAIGEGYAGITSGRVLNAKHSTTNRSSHQSSRQVWDRVAQAAASSSSSNQTPAPRPPERFPALSGPSAPPASAPAFRQGQRNTPWSSSSASGFRAPTALPGSSSVAESRIQVIPNTSSSKPGSGRNTPYQPPPKLSNALFPELPTSSNARQKASVSGNISLKNILGTSTGPTVPAWNSGSNTNTEGNTGSGQAVEPSRDGDGSGGAGKGKKSKGKQKQTLFTLGTFPT